MDLLSVLHFDELSHGLANLSMFPFFDMAHYIVSVMALREQPGECLRDVDDSSSCQVYSVKWLFLSVNFVWLKFVISGLQPSCLKFT